MMLVRKDTNKAYIPDRGDLIWLVLDPRVGHEQAGRRPVIVLSNRLLTERTGLAVICPITSKIKDLPFEIKIKTKKVDGAILPINMRSVDVNVREVRFIEKAPESTLKKVYESVNLLIS